MNGVFAKVNRTPPSPTFAEFRPLRTRRRVGVLVELDVHLGQRLLHALDVGGAVADQGVALAQVAAQHAGLIIGAEGARKQAEGVELLEPLAVLHVARGPGRS